MNTSPILATLSDWIERIACHLRARRRMARERDELSRLSSRELMDMGLSHADVAITRLRAGCGA